jgi:hypothetical protein
MQPDEQRPAGSHAKGARFDEPARPAVTALDESENGLPAREWWGARRGHYFRWLAFSGIGACLLFFALACFLPDLKVPTVFELFGSGLLYVVFLRCANICYCIGPLSERLFRPSDIGCYRRVAYALGFWFSCALPFLIMLATVAIVLAQRGRE